MNFVFNLLNKDIDMSYSATKEVRAAIERLKGTEVKDKLSSLATLPLVGQNPTSQAMADQLRQHQEEEAAERAKIGLEYIRISQDRRVARIEKARKLRAEAKALIASSTDLYNAEQHALRTGDITFLSVLVESIYLSDEDMALLRSEVPNYWKEDQKGQ